MKNKTKNQLSFWSSVVLAMFASWVVFFNAFIDTMQKLGLNLSVDIIRVIAFVIMWFTVGYIVWRFVDKRKFPPY